MHAPPKTQHMPVCTCPQGHEVFLPHTGRVLRPWQMCWAVLGPCLRARVCVASVVHTNPFLITGLIWNLAPTSRVASSPCKSCPLWAASVEQLVVWLLRPSAKRPSHRPSPPQQLSRHAGRPSAPSAPAAAHGEPLPLTAAALPFTGGSRVTLPVPVSERTHLCLPGLFWIPGKL